jgi:hypothetical protein
MKEMRTGNVYVGDTGTVYYLLRAEDNGWYFLFYNALGESRYGITRSSESMRQHIGTHGNYRYVMNLYDIQTKLDWSNYDGSTQTKTG